MLTAVAGRKASIGPAIAVGLVAVAVGLPGCSADNQAAGCTPPPDEPGLLDQYASDPVFAIRPDGAQAVSGIQRSVACFVAPDWPDDPTETAADLRLSVPHRYDLDALTEAYYAAVAAEGWQPVAAPSPPYGDVALRYCKQIRGITSYLLLSAPDLRAQVDVRGPGNSPVPQPRQPTDLPGEIFVRISAAPTEPACPEHN
ncbi:hypothetical protein KBX37_06180 [Micromonospora sp. U56]|uniref:hypothetical protein n=1 Tax=Micromonospora sp. U56 TaxID=2824900 RepID=UPI001B37D8AE|nr:hypothetical protein [Micromonospora sp. U56]MBQ0892695.1 hypothetical protein [Micromonospora sp. U56]